MNRYSDMEKLPKVVGLDVCTVRAVNPGRVSAARRRLISLGEAARLAEVFRLLGDATRARILFALLEAGELCVCDLAVTVEAPETSVSHALRLLRTAGIVRCRRDGRMIHYSLDDAHVRLLLDLTREHMRHEGGRPRKSMSGRAANPLGRAAKRQAPGVRATR
jgi:ArsR family transcriptional regulator, lead/cadmium/zinc/bismuth-responsive transcriptional repressor